VKLVRSRILEIDRAAGGTAVFRPVTVAAELDRLLDAKLDEEIGEYRTATNPRDADHELADVLAALRDIAFNRGITFTDLLEMEARKRYSHGGFLPGVVLVGAEPGPAVSGPSHIIRRTDGGDVHGDGYRFMECDSPDDWTVAEESEHYDGPVEYEILRCVPVDTRTFGEPEPDEFDEATDGYHPTLDGPAWDAHDARRAAAAADLDDGRL
jgi:predicted house-cleaning noncanonical NTP pyrophosphatase (MazG superfamily)